MPSSKISKRMERLASCVKANDVDRLEYYFKRKKYSRLNWDENTVNSRGETLLHLACRLCRPHIVTFLIKHSLGDPTARDLKGNTPLHAALITVAKIDDKNEFISAYRRLILANLKDLSASLDQPNLEGNTGKDLLDLADSVYQYHLAGSNIPTMPTHQLEEEEWRKKLSAELEDEYVSSWGKYEADFTQANQEETETYDSWAQRMMNEHRKRTKTHFTPPATKQEKKPASGWTPEDQQRFLKEEELKRELQRTTDIANKRYQFLSKLQAMVMSERPIEEKDLPFHCSQSLESIGQLILLHVTELGDLEAKRKAMRELQRLWHPDKFMQKFGHRLNETIRDQVLRKVTEISQYMNAYNCSL